MSSYDHKLLRILITSLMTSRRSFRYFKSSRMIGLSWYHTSLWMLLISGTISGKKIGVQMQLLLLGIDLVRLSGQIFPNRVERSKSTVIHELKARKHDGLNVWTQF